MSEPLGIAITCFPTFGGSGVIATEVGLAMAERGHRVHFIARDLPVRLGNSCRGVVFHEVSESEHAALQHSSAYPLALASKMIEVATFESIDVLHVHYAVPHATAAWMAREVLGPAAPRLVTTLHGTDITLVGTDTSYLPITRFSILKSDAVTAPSEFLRDVTWSGLEIPEAFDIEVIPNFVDTERYTPRRDRSLLSALFPGLLESDPVLCHISNFRPLKRVVDVVEVLRGLTPHGRFHLVMVGDGPDRSAAERRVRELGLGERVVFLGKQEDFAELLAAADVFLLPSETESFGLAALEALSCGVPVIATDVGGIPEVVSHGVNGYLAPVGDIAAMVAHALSLTSRPERWAAFSERARASVLERFRREPAIDAYEAVYRRVLGR
jgi:L-malate glycosyltransferase